MEFVVHNLAHEWSKQGHQVLVLNRVTDTVTHPNATYSVAKFEMLRGAPRFGFHRFPFAWYTRRSIKKILDEFEPDFISLHMGYPTGHWLESLRPRRDYVITCHGRDITLFDWGHRRKYGIDRELKNALNHSIGAIAISSHARAMMEDLGVSPSVIRDIPNGVDIDRFQKQIDFNFRERLNLPEDAVIVLSVGREHPQKNYASGIRAFSNVAKNQEGIFYVIVGDKVDQHQPLLNQLNLGDRVKLCDVLHGDDLVGAYQQADLLFSPSIWEMMPLVVLESMAAGLPAVVTNISGSQDLIVNSKTGYIVEPDDLDEMAQALLRLACDSSLRESFKRNVFERIKAYSWDEISRRYLDLMN